MSEVKANPYQWNNKVREELVSAIRKYSAMGIPTFQTHRPVAKDKCGCGNSKCHRPGKHPKTKNGLYDASCDPEKVLNAANSFAPFNLAIPTGKPSNFLALDVDYRNGGTESLAKLAEKYGALPETPISVTGGGLQHILRHPTSKLSNAVGFEDGLDIRSDGGYIIAPPSLHKSGKKYFWDAAFHLDDIPLADPPTWLIDLLTTKTSTGKKTDAHWQDLAASRISEGKRHSTIVSVVGHLLGKRVNPVFALRLAWSFNRTQCDPPLEDEEVCSIVESITRLNFQSKLRRLQ